MTQVLARKWRPKNFIELIGQQHVVQALTHALNQQRLHHAYLFTGTRGVGKTTVARIIAKALNCQIGITSQPCGVCTTCTEIDSGRFIDLVELDAASNTQVDSMRELLEGARYAPTSGRFKVYLIDEVHMLSKSAFNAMLKTLEEPPAHVKFILATTDPQKIPVTVLSRCLQFNLKQIPVPQIEAQLQHILKQENITAEQPALKLLAYAAEGSMRDALSLLDQAIIHGAGKIEESAVRSMLGVIDRSYLFAMLEKIASNDGAGILAEADQMQARSIDFDMALQDLAAILHRIAIIQTIPGADIDDELNRRRLEKLAHLFAAEDIQLFYQIALQGRQDIGLAPDEYSGFTMTLLRMLAFSPHRVTTQQLNNPTTAVAVEQNQEKVTPPAESPASHEQSPSPDLVPAGAQTNHMPSLAVTDLSPETWPDFIKSLKLSGMAQVLASHCALIKVEGNLLYLNVPPVHKTLLDKPYREKLQTVLQEYFGLPVRVILGLDSGAQNTLVLQQGQAEKDKHSKAMQAIEGDPFVRGLITEFDGKIIKSTVKLIEG